MKRSARYAKIVEWSDEDGCYVGSAPGLVLGGCHGDNEKEVFAELCQIVEEAIEIYEKDAEVRYVVIDCAAGEDLQAFVARAMRIRPGCTIVGQCEQRFDIEFARAGIRDTIRKPWTVSDFMSLLIDHE